MSSEVPTSGQDSVDDDQEFDGGGADIRQFVTFIAGNEVFAVDMAPVQEIIRLPEVVKLPLAPRTLDGLANLRGKVLPIISLRRIFGFEERAYDESSRAVVIDLGQPLGFVVDRVASVVGVDPKQIEDTGELGATVKTELLSGVIKNVGGYPMIMVLDFAKLIAGEFAGAAASSHAHDRAALASQHSDTSEADHSADELHLVSFEVANQEYAITIEDVQEIVQLPETIMHVPNSQLHVLGVMTLRNRLLPLVSLRQMFGLSARAADDQSRIMVVSLGSASVGVVMDSVNAVLRVARSEVDETPSLLAKSGNLSDISQICRLDGGKRLVSILSVENMFRHASVKEALSTMDTATDKQERDAKDEDGMTNDDEEQVVVFRLGKEEFGVPIASVQEIVRVGAEMTNVPKAPPAVEGMINLRGAVLPVMDLRRRLGLEAIARSDGQRIIVLLIGGVRTGFIVDSVAEVLKIHKSTVEATPHLSGEQARLLARVANLQKQKRMVQLIDPTHLIEKHELEGLTQLAAA